MITISIIIFVFVFVFVFVFFFFFFFLFFFFFFFFFIIIIIFTFAFTFIYIFIFIFISISIACFISCRCPRMIISCIYLSISMGDKQLYQYQSRISNRWWRMLQRSEHVKSKCTLRPLIYLYIHFLFNIKQTNIYINGRAKVGGLDQNGFLVRSYNNIPLSTFKLY